MGGKEKKEQRCTLCGGLMKKNGIYYVCSICYAQSQFAHDEVMEDGDIIMMGGTRRSVALLKKKVVGTEEELIWKRSDQRMNYWQTVQHLLSLNVNALIQECNVSPIIQPVVGSIWMACLHEPTFVDLKNKISIQRRDNKISKEMPHNLLLGICYVACQWCRLPVTPGDLYLWTIANKIPYRGSHVLPFEVGRLQKGVGDLLTTSSNTILSPDSITDLSYFFCTLLNITLPPLNRSALLLRLLNDLHFNEESKTELFDIADRLDLLFQREVKKEVDLSDFALVSAQVIVAFRVRCGCNPTVIERFEKFIDSWMHMDVVSNDLRHIREMQGEEARKFLRETKKLLRRQDVENLLVDEKKKGEGEKFDMGSVLSDDVIDYVPLRYIYSKEMKLREELEQKQMIRICSVLTGEWSSQIIGAITLIERLLKQTNEIL
ncbi:hypothetical protein PROFUN_05876 [Planoprotostelium fungivorum]|uniref:Rrn7/TAF1B N-terminal cyclin domain-containing protein n=1 Tax=Planoprotostelium fungivorum TaxID=1890364 RepID=A0A2P6NKQ0_9EUKA|nr:hypothetical protein PROFUN_05876 [Planoprotostelium fungivorum]